jgi:hypothetical protein
LSSDCMEKGCLFVQGRGFAENAGACDMAGVACGGSTPLSLCLYYTPGTGFLQQEVLMQRESAGQIQVVVSPGRPVGGEIVGWSVGCAPPPDCAEFVGIATQ